MSVAKRAPGLRKRRPGPGSACAFALLGLLSWATAARAADIAKQTTDFGGRSRSYYFYVPDTLPPDPAPLLVLLHGSGRDGHAITRLWKADAERRGIILVAPNALDAGAWRLRDDGPDFIRAAIDAAAAARSIDASRTYLFGQSGGAVHALLLSMLESQYFAATAVHAGAWRKNVEYLALRYVKRSIPLAIVIGDRDEFFPMAAVHRTERALKKTALPIEVHVIAGQHHWYNSDTAPQINTIAWGFLEDKKLDGAPVFSRYRMDAP